MQSDRKGDHAPASRQRGSWFDLAVLCGALQELFTFYRKRRFLGCHWIYINIALCAHMLSLGFHVYSSGPSNQYAVLVEKRRALGKVGDACRSSKIQANVHVLVVGPLGKDKKWGLSSWDSGSCASCCVALPTHQEAPQKGTMELYLYLLVAQGLPTNSSFGTVGNASSSQRWVT